MLIYILYIYIHIVILVFQPHKCIMPPLARLYYLQTEILYWEEKREGIDLIDNLNKFKISIMLLSLFYIKF